MPFRVDSRTARKPAAARTGACRNRACAAPQPPDPPGRTLTGSTAGPADNRASNPASAVGRTASSRTAVESGNRGRKSVVIDLRSAVGFRHRPDCSGAGLAADGGHRWSLTARGRALPVETQSSRRVRVAGNTACTCARPAPAGGRPGGRPGQHGGGDAAQVRMGEQIVLLGDVTPRSARNASKPGTSAGSCSTRSPFRSQSAQCRSTRRRCSSRSRPDDRPAAASGRSGRGTPTRARTPKGAVGVDVVGVDANGSARALFAHSLMIARLPMWPRGCSTASHSGRSSTRSSTGRSTPSARHRATTSDARSIP